MKGLAGRPRPAVAAKLPELPNSPSGGFMVREFARSAGFSSGQVRGESGLTSVRRQRETAERCDLLRVRQVRHVRQVRRFQQWPSER